MPRRGEWRGAAKRNAEAIAMLADRYMRKRYEEGRKAGIDQVRRLEKERWRRYLVRVDAWDERRLAAQAEGEPFDEPMPVFGDEGVTYRDILTEAERRPDGSIGVWIRVGRMICWSFRR